jgi:hypothetical protein
MADKQAKWMMRIVFGASLWFVAGFAAASEQKGNVDPAMKQYLDCINGAARNQQAEGADKITNAQSVLASCASEKQALLQARPDARIAQLVARIEQHLRSRERAK